MSDASPPSTPREERIPPKPSPPATSVDEAKTVKSDPSPHWSQRGKSVPGEPVSPATTIQKATAASDASPPSTPREERIPPAPPPPATMIDKTKAVKSDASAASSLREKGVPAGPPPPAATIDKTKTATSGASPPSSPREKAIPAQPPSPAPVIAKAKTVTSGAAPRFRTLEERVPVELPPPAPTIETTYKAREVESRVDLYFYRRVGYWVARFFAEFHASPTALTLTGGFFGILAGHLYFYNSIAANMLGLGLHVVANIFDNADGQLARLTNQRTRTGRIIDPVVDHLIWLSVYFHLALRLTLAGFSPAVWLLAIAAGISHGAQAAAADYCRNAYLHFAKGRDDLDSVSQLRNDYRFLRWDRDPWRKFLFALYLNVMKEQELLVPGVNRLQNIIARTNNNQVLVAVQTRYPELIQPTFRWWGWLMTNPRMALLFILFLWQQPILYFWIVLIIGNLLLYYLLLRQNRATQSIVAALTAPPQAA